MLRESIAVFLCCFLTRFRGRQSPRPRLFLQHVRASRRHVPRACFAFLPAPVAYLTNASRVVIGRFVVIIRIYPALSTPIAPATPGRPAQPQGPNWGTARGQYYPVRCFGFAKIRHERPAESLGIDSRANRIPAIKKNFPIPAVQNNADIIGLMIVQRPVTVRAQPFVQRQLPATPRENMPSNRLRVVAWPDNQIRF
jgi:hypothetical protein